ncbi:TonB-dependent receptor (plasmid) [Rhizorhabdus wittichii RW1]|uniref:TonB-dependent receptor n=1 Tax=Rhizorhabdus wittichii (strain DSM 6014 / CCUG 31198 / JCM 15750 / NBRC 105917 / EY 4224 / RW1) TaxID=392499 RepID=A0A9J9LGL4_RHIWR|nr:TonB-dependent receptor [Rhizorhabdus wittichii RW1]
MGFRHSIHVSALASVATLALATAAFSAPAMAQEAAADDSGAIIVTARRREESLIDVPISVTAISGDALQKSGAIDITDISQSVPNVTLETSRGTNSTLTAFIRGVGQQDPVAGFEAGVGLYLDDVYLNRPQAAVLDIYDVERVEVLRGPQGTLYGRNTIGGAVKYVTKRLTTDPTLSVRGTYGSYDQADGVITASTPVGDGTLKFGGALARLSRGGFGDNLTTGRENYNKDVWAGRLSAQADGEGFFVRLTGDYTKDKSEPRGGHRLIPGLFSGAPVLNDVYDTRAGLLDPKQDVEAYGVSLFGEFEVTDGFTLRSITAWRKDNSATPIDFDSLAAVDGDVPAFHNNRQLSQEIQLLVSTGNLNGLIGGYFLDAKARTVFDARLPGGVTPLTFGDVGTETFAIFGDFTYDFTPQLSLSVGGRYTWDERTSQILRRTYLGGGSPFFGGTGTLFATTSDFRGSQTFKEFTPRASLSFKPTQDQTLYASYAKGFKGGGFDPRGQSTACRTPTGGTCTPQQVFDFLSFDPETVETYEVGYKASYGRRLTIALSGFYSDYTDVQVPGSIGTTVNGQQTFVGITTNAGKARIQGIEFEGNLLVAKDIGAPGSRLNLNWAGGYIDAKYKQFIDSRGIDVANRRAFQNTPKWTASGTLAYSIPAFGGDISTSTTVSYRSKSQQFELRTPGLDQAGYALWDASIVWTSEGGRYSLGVHGRNLTDKQYIVSGNNFLSQNPDTGNFNRNAAGALIPTLGREGVLTAYYGNPRQVFVSAGVKF